MSFVKAFINKIKSIGIFFLCDLRRSWKLPLIIAAFFLIIVGIVPNLSSSLIHAADDSDKKDTSACRPGKSSDATEAVARKVADTFATQGPWSANCANIQNIYNSPPIPLNAGTGSTQNQLPTGFTYYQGGATTASFILMGRLYDKQPASTPEYLYNVAVNSRIGPAQTANAQVQGFETFSPLITLWSFFRNISYVLFIAVFVISGFLILIQNKIGGREAVTFANSIVPAVIALVVITFSYPIASLLVDLCINVGNGVVATTFNQFVNSTYILDQLNKQNSNVNVLTIFNSIQYIGVGNALSNLGSNILGFLKYPVSKINDLFGSVTGVGFIFGFIAQIFTSLLIGILENGFNSNAIIEAIVAFIVFITMIRTVFALLGAYVSIVFKIMFAPLALIPAAFPGGGGIAVITNWIKGIVASALVFPIIFAMMLLVGIFMNLSYSSTQNSCYYVSQFSGGSNSNNTIPGAKDTNNIFNTTPAQNSPKDANGESGVSKTSCLPLALPNKFNVWPAPLGYIPGVDPDAIIRLVIGFSFILIMPTVPKIISEALGIRANAGIAAALQGAKAGVSTFSSLVSAVPSLGVGRAIGQFTNQAAGSL